MHKQEIEEEVAAWLEGIADRGAISAISARELESHLYDAIEEEMAAGLDADQAFESAVAKLGDPAELEAEFAKVYPEVSWVRRALWLATGYALVGLVLKLSHWAYTVVESLVMQFFPTSLIDLKHAVTIKSIEENIFLANFGRGDVTFTQLHTATIAACAARLGLLLVCFIWVASVLRRRPKWACRLRRDNKRLSVAVLASVGAQFVLSMHWPYRIWQQMCAHLGFENWETLAFLEFGQAERAAGDWWVSERLMWIEGVLLIGIAFWLLNKICRGRTEGSAAGWLYAGYFTIAGIGYLLGVLGMGVAFLATEIFPSLSQNLSQSSWLNPVFWVGTPAGILNVVTQLGIFAVLLVGLWLLFGRRRSMGIAERLRGREGWFLALWMAVYFLPLFVLRATQISLPDSLMRMAAHTWIPKGIWITALVVVVTILASWREGRKQEPLQGGIAQ